MLTVTPLNVGTLELERGVVSLNRFGPNVSAPVWAWLVRSGNDVVLVDSGTPRPDWCAENARPVRDATETQLYDCLARHDVAPAAVTSVVLTHLHWDHVGGLGIFENADIYVQTAEKDYATAPLWMHESSYAYAQQSLIHEDQIRGATELDGRAEIRRGISALPAPGHTPGSQVVVVGAGSGSVVLAADTVSVAENLGAGPDGRTWPGGVFVDLDAYITTLDRLAMLPGTLLAGHDPGITADTPITVT